LARQARIGAADVPADLRHLSGERLTAEFVREARAVLQDRWLARDRSALSAVVDALWKPGGKNGHRRLFEPEEQLAWLEVRNTTTRLCEVLLEHFIVLGSKPPVVAPAGPAPSTNDLAALV
jgi:hypothetical protein